MLTSEQVRAKLSHPTIDCDGHMVEHLGLLAQFLNEQEPGLAERYRAYSQRVPLRGEGSLEGDFKWRYQQTPWWGHAAVTLDRATAYAPGLMYKRMDELGLDVMLLYPSLALSMMMIPDAAMRIPVVTAVNRMLAEIWAPYSDRIIPAAAIPMYDVAETVEHLRTSAAMGHKIVAIPANVARPIPGVHALAPGAYPSASWPDHYGLDTQDYGPVWAEAQRLKLAVSSHGNTSCRYVHSGRRSPTNFMFNHIGSHSYQQGELTRSLFMSGVTRRFPAMRIAALECGVSWAVQMVMDLVERWEKRGGDHIQQYDPARVDWPLFTSLLREHGGPRFANVELVEDPMSHKGAPPHDDFGEVPCQSAEQLIKDFADHFYFGCNSDDRGTSWAFRNPGGFVLKAMFASDVAHWDVPNMANCVAESYEFITRDELNEDEYRKLMFDHVAEYLRAANPDFFAGTIIADRF